ncbi:helix-turn-helix domain-containing protein [Pseudonocardia nigra]|uniref:helix-turn-helix domain-containing protein n=1 Tax=Pseudonocardia nigra TaxID=1921578 RepID=UPI001C5ECEC4|nr:helix-turn-helix domain-containing protein [Pseudonocardia nigra]
MSGRPVRVADLLADPLLAQATTLAGAAGLDRVVRNVAWYGGELPGTADGHLVVCDAARVVPPYRLDALVRRAEAAGVAGLVLAATGAPPLLSSIRLADRLRIPVLAAGEVDLVELLHRLTVRVRAPELVRARLVEELVRRLANKATGPDVVATASQVLAAPVSVLAPDGAAVAGDPVALPPGLRLDLAVAQHADLAAGGRLLVHPVGDQRAHRPAAWLTCALPGGDDGRREAVAAGLAVTEPFVRAWLTGQRAAADRDTAFQAHLLTEILAGRAALRRDVAESAVSLGWRLPDWHVGLHLIVDGAGADPDRWTITVQLRGTLGEHGLRPTAVIDRGDAWSAWLSRDAEPGPDDGRAVVHGVRRALAALPRGWGAVAGIGRPHRGPTGLAETLAEARDAAYLARSHEHRPAAEHVDEFGVARLLATWQRSEILQAFADSALAPLRDIEGGQLLVTLRAYLEANGSITGTAQLLGLHRNTVTTRLHRLRGRLGVDLDDASQRLALQMACRTLDRPGT